MSNETLKKALLQSIDRIERNPRGAQVIFRARTRLEEGVRCTARVRDFPALTVDEPPELGGENAAMNPVELLLAALGTCQEIMYAAYAAVMDIEIEELKIDCRGNLDLRGLFGLEEGVPPGFTEIRFETRIKSSASAERVQALVDMAQGHCPLLDTLTRHISTRGSAYLNGTLIGEFAAKAPPSDQ